MFSYVSCMIMMAPHLEAEETTYTRPSRRKRSFLFASSLVINSFWPLAPPSPCSSPLGAS